MSTHSTNMSPNIDRLRIATPCPISWEQMTGDNRVRFCDHCRLNVYNISELSRPEAETLIASTEGRLCARLYRRSDGTILTKDCPVGLRALRLRVSKRAAAVFAAIASLASVAVGQQSSAKDGKTECIPQTRITRTTAPPEHLATVLSGNLLDPTGAVVAGAKITITNDATKETLTSFSNDTGRFEFTSLASGTYSLTIEGLGFQTLNLTNVSVEIDKIVNLESIIEIFAQVTSGITSMDYAPVDTSRPGTTIISGDLIRRLPIQ